MKKIVAVLLTLVLCLSAAAMAATPSKTNADLTRFDVEAENQPGDKNIYLLPVNKVTVGDALPDYQERLDICEVEIAKLAASPTVEDYFAGATDAEGNEADLREMLGTEEDAALNVFEFWPVIAGGFREDCGKVTATMLFSTPYEKDQPVVVMVGIVTVHEDGTQEVVWQAFEGVGLGEIEGEEESYGAIHVVFTQEIVNAIQSGIALMAVVSAETEAA